MQFGLSRIIDDILKAGLKLIWIKEFEQTGICYKFFYLKNRFLDGFRLLESVSINITNYYLMRYAGSQDSPEWRLNF
jgi:hypothetical protein